MSVRISIDSLRLPSSVDPRQIPARTRQGLLNTMINYNAAMQIADVIPQDQGSLAANINASVSATEKEGTVATSFIYGAVMESLDGRSPGTWPPIDAIENWVRRKIKPKPPKLTKAGKKRIKGKSKKEKKAARINRVEAAIKGTAFAIAQKIFLEGIAVPLTADGKGNMFQRTLDDTQDKFSLWFVEGFEGAKVA